MKKITSFIAILLVAGAVFQIAYANVHHNLSNSFRGHGISSSPPSSLPNSFATMSPNGKLILPKPIFMGVTKYPPLPKGFNPLKASNAELQKYGFPPRPSSGDRGWVDAMKHFKQFETPVYEPTDSTDISMGFNGASTYINAPTGIGMGLAMPSSAK